MSIVTDDIISSVRTHSLKFKHSQVMIMMFDSFHLCDDISFNSQTIPHKLIATGIITRLGDED